MMRALSLLLAIGFFLWLNWRFRDFVDDLKAPPESPVHWSPSLHEFVDDVVDRHPRQLVSAKDALEIFRRGEGVFIDVRSPEEQAVSHIPGAILAQPGNLDVDVEPWKSLDQAPIIVYCTVGERSAVFKDAMRAKGWHAFNMLGGLCAWSFESGPLVDAANQPTRRVHVWSEDFAGAVSPDAVAVWEPTPSD